MSDQTAVAPLERGFFHLKHPRKSPVMTLLLSFFLGGFGFHRFYLGKLRSGTVMFVLSAVTIALIINGLSKIETMSWNGMLAIVSGAMGFGIVVSAWAIVDLLVILIGVFDASSRVREAD